MCQIKMAGKLSSYFFCIISNHCYGGVIATLNGSLADNWHIPWGGPHFRKKNISSASPTLTEALFVQCLNIMVHMNTFLDL